MKKMQKLILILFLSTGLSVISCSREPLPHAAGARDHVVIIIPRGGEDIGSLLTPYIEKVYFYPSREKVYVTEVVGPGKLQTYRYWRNLVMIGWLNTYIDTLLSPEALSQVKKDGGVFHLENMYVSGQTVILIAGKDKKTVEKLIKDYGETIYLTLRKGERNRIAKLLYMDGEQKKMEDTMRRLLGAWVRVPLGYQVSVREDNIFSIIRTYPDRLVTIYYNKGTFNGDPIHFRDSLFTRYFEADSILKERTKIDSVDFNGIKAIRMRGIWQNMKKVMGGPFISYIINKDGFYYFIDGHVFAPSKKKWPYLEEVDIIMHTFRTEL